MGAGVATGAAAAAAAVVLGPELVSRPYLQWCSILVRDSEFVCSANLPFICPPFDCTTGPYFGERDGPPGLPPPPFRQGNPVAGDWGG